MEEQFIGSYKVLKKIGAGGMSRVYLAVHQDVPNLKVILKILSDPRLGERFRHEADKLALLDGHPSVCRIKHFFNHGEDTVIAMEYIEGITLEEKIRSEGKLSTEESLQIISDLLDILEFAHQKGIYHRDIKPGNIMIDKKGQVKIIDFGIAKAKTDPNLTLAGTACGTPAYMAPEQFTPTQDTNYALVDIYAAGTTLYTMLTGECPFKGDNEFAIRDAKLFSEAPKPRSLNPDIPKPVEEIIMKSLIREPAERYQSANEMRAALEATHRTVKKRAPSEPADMTIDIRAPSQRKIRKPLLAGIAVIVLVLVVLVAYKFWPSDREEGKEAKLDTIAVPEDTTDEGFDISGIPIVPATGTINISVTPSGDIYVDDSLLGRRTKSATLTCDTGIHIVRVENKKATRTRLQDTVLLAANQELPLTYRFIIPQEPPPPRPEPAFGQVRVGSNPAGADVYIDGEKQRGKTIYTFKLKPGEHIIAVELDYEGTPLRAEQTVLVKKDSTHKVVFDLMNK
jgi:serine/threonine protein kinase